MKVSLKLLLAIALASTPAAAQQVVFDGGAPTLANTGDNMSSNRLANSFSLTTGGSIGAVRFWGLSKTGGLVTPVDWEILADNAGTPGALLGSGQVTPTQTPNDPGNTGSLGYTSYQEDFSLGSTLTLGSGNFWLALHDGASSNDASGPDFRWQMTQGGDPRPYSMFVFQAPGDAAWNHCNSFCSNDAFELLAPAVTTTPEPTSLALLGTGLFALIPIARRRIA